MKKLFLLAAVAMTSAFEMSAQTLATFENDGVDDKIQLQGWWNPDHYAIGPEIMSNDKKNDINPSEKAMGIVLKDGADWWGQFVPFRLKNEESYEITEANRYLKMDILRTTQECDVVVYLLQDNDQQIDNEIWRGKLKNTGEWNSLVLDLGAKYMGTTFRGFLILPNANWSDPRYSGPLTILVDNVELSDNVLPKGVTPIADLSKFDLGFESEETTNQWVSNITPLHDENSYSIVENPVPSEVNKTSKVVEFKKSENASWWRGLMFQYANALTVSPEHKYMHVMVYVPSSALEGRESVDLQLCAADFTGSENSELFTIWDDETDGWIDLVMEVNNIAYITEMTVRFDLRKDADDNYINSPANTFYVDGMTMNNSAAQRTELTSSDPTSIKNILNLDNVIVVGAKGAIEVAVDGKATVEVYNPQGVRVSNATVDQSTTIPAERGCYVLKVTTAEGQKISKVIVQ